MYSFLAITARIKPDTDYDWFTYGGRKPVPVNYRGTERLITKGTRFGVRPSTNGKSIRLVFPNEITKVYTIDLDTAKALAKGVVKE